MTRTSLLKALRLLAVFSCALWSLSAMAVLTISTSSPLPNGAIGKTYSQTLVATGGVSPYSWSVLSGSLPPGIVLNSSSGLLSGTPTTLGTFSVTIKVQDNASASTSKPFSIAINIGDDDEGFIAMAVSALRPVCTNFIASPNPVIQANSLSFAVSCTNTPTSYEWRQGSNVWTTSSPSLSITAPTVTGPYIYTVTANRGALRSAALSTSVTVNPNNPPNITAINSPANGASLTPGSVSSIALYASDPDSNLAHVDLSVNGSLVQSFSSGGSLSASYAFSTSGVYVISAIATDSNGATSTSTSVVTVLNDAAIAVPNDANAIAGSLQGSAGVSQTGAGTYVIPLAIPPGTAGVMPQLKLSYSSQAPDGTLGAGWSLTGLSRITRCARDLARDSYAGKVSIDASDRFCLDGQRLMLVNGTGNYGDSGSEYRTEIESFSKIIAYNFDVPPYVNWVGPSWFKVWTKNGQILYYGYDNNLTFDQSSTIRRWGSYSGHTGVAWYLFRVEDRYGNYMTVQYAKSQTLNDALGQQDVDHRPVAVYYTGNGSQAAYAKITLDYENRPDGYKGFLAGVRVDNQYRLKAIKTWINADSNPTLVNEYRLGYSASSQSGRSLLATVSMCDASGACNPGGSTALPSTVFEYQQRSASDNVFSATPWLGGPVVSAANQDFTHLLTDTAFGDFNGDGKTDIAQWTGGVWKISRSTGSSFALETWAWNGPSITATKNALFGDFNGDGKTDIAIPPNTDNVGTWSVCLSAGNAAQGFNCQSWSGRASWTVAGRYLIGDFTGDGIDDVAMIDVGTGYHGDSLCISLGNGFNCIDYANVTTAKGTTYGDDVRVFPISGDFNGDGRLDVALWTSGTGGMPGYFTLCRASDSTTPHFDCTLGGSPTFPGNIGLPYSGGSISADVGADGYTDLIAAQIPNAGNVCRSTGVALECTTLPNTGNGADYVATVVGDFDGDGRQDSLHYDYVANRWKVCQLGWYINTSNYSNGTNTYSCADWGGIPATPSSTFIGPLQGDFNGDGKTDLAFYDTTTNQWTVALSSSGAKPDLLAKITDGNGAITRFDYDRLSSGVVYTPDDSFFYPRRDVNDPSFVVATLHRDNGLGGTFDTTYRYGGLKVDVSGRGLLGFRWVEAHEVGSNLTTHTEYAQVFPLTGLVTSQTVSVGPYIAGCGSTSLKCVTNTLSSQAGTTGNATTSVFPFVQQSSEQARELDGTPAVGSVSTTTSYSQYGIVNDILVSNTMAGETRTSHTVNSPKVPVDAANWLIEEIDRTQITKTGPTTPTTVTRTVTYGYDAKGRVNQEIVEPFDSTLTLTTSYSRNTNIWGLVDKKTISWLDPRSGSPTSRDIETVIAFESKGRYARIVANAAGQRTTTDYKAEFGTVSTVTDPNGLQTSYSYDAFGRRVVETRPDATTTATSYRRYMTCGSTNCPTLVVSVVISKDMKGSAQPSVPSVSYRDALGREVMQQTWGFAGAEIRSEKTYDATTGFLYQRNLPHYTSTAGIPTTFHYDALGRIDQLKFYDETGVLWTEMINYTNVSNGFRTTYTDANNHTRKEVRNGIGGLKQVIDAKLVATDYEYDPFGNLTKMTPGGIAANAVSISYDNLGRKRSLVDPDLGTWNYSIDPLGQTWHQVDGIFQATDFYYDALGRMYQRTEPGQISSWTFDTCQHGVGRLCSASAPGYSRVMSYDELSRVTATSTTISGTSLNTVNSYDAYGRLQSRQHCTGSIPTGRCDGPTARPIVLGFGYNTYGFAKEIKGSNGSLWIANSASALGQIKDDVLGSGSSRTRTYNPNSGRLTAIAVGSGIQTDTYQYDPVGNVTNRTQLNGSGGSVSEAFTYDELDRLKTSTVSNQPVKQFTYDSAGLGNLATKDGATYTYNATCGTRTCPHAAKTVTGIAGSFMYDGNGNLLNVNNGLVASYTWTPANQPAQINKNGVTETFTYGPERQKTSHSSLGSTVLYAGSVEQQTTGATTTLKVYLPDGIGFVSDDGTMTGARYFLQDNLGSTVVIIDAAGTVLQRLSYDPWGKRRNLNGTDDSSNTLTGQERYGYIGEEQLDGTRLMHLNGRVYDPSLGRFTSPDPSVSEPDDLQSFNRFSYAMNRPMTFVDPTGYDVVRPTSSLVGVPDNCSDRPRICNIWLGHGAETIISPAVANAWLASQSASGMFVVDTSTYRPSQLPVLAASSIVADDAGPIRLDPYGYKLTPEEIDCDQKENCTNVRAYRQFRSEALSILLPWTIQARETYATLRDSRASGLDKVLAVAPFVPGGAAGRLAVTQTLAATRAASAFGGLTHAAQFGAQPYARLAQMLRGTGLQAHHLIEKRFAILMGHNPRQSVSVAVTPAEHQSFTNAWRNAIPYGAGTANATEREVVDAARQIYMNYPEILRALGL